MKIDNNTVDRIAFLAKLHFPGERKEKMRKDLENILDLCEKLSKVDTSDVEPMIFVSDEHNRLATDKAEEPLSKKNALANAPRRDSDYFKVPRFKK